MCVCVCVCVYARTYQRYMLTIKSKILKYISRSRSVYIYTYQISSPICISLYFIVQPKLHQYIQYVYSDNDLQ